MNEKMTKCLYGRIFKFTFFHTKFHHFLILFLVLDLLTHGFRWQIIRSLKLNQMRAANYFILVIDELRNFTNRRVNLRTKATAITLKMKISTEDYEERQFFHLN